MVALTDTIKDITGETVSGDDIHTAFVRSPTQRPSYTGQGLVSTRPVKISDGGELALDLEPGPAVLVVLGPSFHDTWELYVEEGQSTIRDAVAAVPGVLTQHEVSVLRTLLDGAEEAADTAGTAAGTATTAAQQAGQDRTLVQQIRDLLEEAYNDSAAGFALPPRLTESALSATYVPKLRGVQRMVYVRETGDDATADGSWGAPFRQISTAVASLATDGPVIPGSVIVDVAAGTYDGNIRLPMTRGVAQDDFVKIVGRKDANGVPTVTIAVSSGRGLLVEDGTALWLEDLKFTGGFSAAVQATRNVYLWNTNIHIDGQGVGVRGMSISTHCRYYVKGGLIENCTYAGIDEYFLVSRSYATVSTAADQMLIRNCPIGIRAKEGCVGHLDYLSVEDCGVGIELLQNCVANLKGVTLKRNGTGLALTNSTSHNEGGVVWGHNADANGREVYSVGMSGELRALMWSGEGMAAGSTTGHRPLMMIANDYAQRTLSGASGDTLALKSFSQVLPRAFFRTVGKHFKIRIVAGFTGAASGTPVTLIARVGSVLLGTLQVKDSMIVAAEFDTVCTADRVSHMTHSTLIGATTPSSDLSRTSTGLAGDPSGVGTLSLTANLSAAQSVEVHSIEVWG